MRPALRFILGAIIAWAIFDNLFHAVTLFQAGNVDWAVDKAFLAAFIAIGCCRIEINRSGPTAAA